VESIELKIDEHTIRQGDGGQWDEVAHVCGGGGRFWAPDAADTANAFVAYLRGLPVSGHLVP
jgi:hypothetical protein